ncbi:restriction endonuclease subunit S [Ensifer sp.]|uniref:restriction endonuclease subunit S n=1 Tax=Ensifer sp. TaxID=1872086 RepID=UPI0028A00CCE|nr:restriction endonuclease subunit S [Ensifer sp.]
MNAERLLQHYEKIADAPDAIARLRRFTLDLAVRGKLVPQDPADEPASELLKRIADEKVRLVKAGEIRTPKPTSDLADVPFPIPPSWSWSQIAEIGVLSPRNGASDTLEASFVPMPLIAAEYGVANKHEVRAWGEIKKGYTHFSEGDVGLAKITPCFENGKSTVFRNLTGGVGSGTTELHIVRPLLIAADYILLFFKSPYFIQTGIPKMTGTAGQKRVPTEYFANSPFPLPPLAEQHRIVAKVDELMVLCDQLEAARTEREAKRDRMAAASLAHLNNPAPETFRDDARFALDAVPALTARPDQIKQLRQTILNLAVRGKLVPQDPTDEPVSVSLRKLAIARNILETEGKIRRLKSAVAVENDPFKVPSYWEWVRLIQICDVVDPNPSHRMPAYVTEGGLPFVSSENFADGDTIRFSIGKRVNAATVQEQIERFSILEGAFGFTRIGTIGKSRPLPTERNYGLSHAVCIVNPLDVNQLSMRYLRLAMTVDGVLAHAHGGTRSIGVPDLGMAVIRTMAIPLPPLAEQRRIVAKVDELMSLCDQLEASLTSADGTRRKLLDALLAEALAPVDVVALQEAAE